MIRQVIKIDEDKCTGCGICADACQEGAIGIVDGKAKLLRDDYCDGLGNCLPTCPTNAISFETREAAAFDEDAVKQNMQKAKNRKACVCLSRQYGKGYKAQYRNKHACFNEPTFTMAGTNQTCTCQRTVF